AGRRFAESGTGRQGPPRSGPVRGHRPRAASSCRGPTSRRTGWRRGGQRSDAGSPAGHPSPLRARPRSRFYTQEMPSARGVAALRRLIPYFSRYRRELLLGLVCILATTAIQLLSPWVLKYAVDDLTLGVTQRKLVFYAVLLFVIAAIGGLFRFLMRRIIIGVSRHIEYDLRNDFFTHLQRFPPSFFGRRRVGDLMSRATNDLNAVRMM